MYSDKRAIIEWLETYQIKNYTLVADDTYGYRVDIAGTVDIYGKNIDRFPVKFGNILHNFYCDYNELTTLEGAPDSVGGEFVCNHNRLTSIAYMPKVVGRIELSENEQLGEFQKVTRYSQIADVVDVYRERERLAAEVVIPSGKNSVIKL